MGSSMEGRGSAFDTSQPGIRQLQNWIRQRCCLAVQLCDGSSVSGIPRWVDPDYLALEPSTGGELLLVNRAAIALIRPLV
jgi:host factor-I protein